MGADIHMYIEKRRNHDKKWELDNNHILDSDGYINDVYSANRNYNLFGKIAGVRGDGQLFDLRGFPDDGPQIIQEWIDDAWGYDAHSRTWVTLEEFIEALYISEKEAEEYWKDSKSDYIYKNECSSNSIDELREQLASLEENHSCWSEYKGGYTSILQYCFSYIDEIEGENILLNRSDKPEIRFLIFFDN